LDFEKGIKSNFDYCHRPVDYYERMDKGDEALSK
jgi:hypothetical protein